ncbi:ABC transporter ATP-binding protein [Chakrabartyella piscis]|uniref:ABC transporter ATP-binding protein n=1 Tax=Chakrabartyella piscis TaxID=2918914 RepID=UPI00295841E8|nr:ABC transporter ATP-binding protein [Chakrabartyella piscis]
MLNIKNLDFAYGKLEVLQNINATIETGKVTTILGANGSGKSTLLHILSKNLKQQSGEILLNEENIKNISLKEFAKKVAMVHQKNNAPNDLTVEQLVDYGRLPYASILKTSLDAENQKYVDKALALTDLTELKDRAIGTLSGGQRQRAFIAMALAQNTNYLFLDEPTTFLDVKYQVEIMRLVQKLNKDEGITILMVLHDINQAVAYSDQIIGIKKGDILFQGQPETVISEENIKNLYGIDLPVFTHEGKQCVLAV